MASLLTSIGGNKISEATKRAIQRKKQKETANAVVSKKTKKYRKVYYSKVTAYWYGTIKMKDENGFFINERIKTVIENKYAIKEGNKISFYNGELYAKGDRNLITTKKITSRSPIIFVSKGVKISAKVFYETNKRM